MDYQDNNPKSNPAVCATAGSFHRAKRNWFFIGKVGFDAVKYQYRIDVILLDIGRNALSKIHSGHGW